MTDQKHATPTKLLWLDMEMTGLNPVTDRIIEVAAIVTDWDFKELGSIERGVQQDQPLLKDLFEANPWAMGRPNETNELLEISKSGIPEAEAEAEVLKLVDAHFCPTSPCFWPATPSTKTANLFALGGLTSKNVCITACSMSAPGR
jgi:oligoribonuclease